jgi:hypothetical protein
MQMQGLLNTSAWPKVLRAMQAKNRKEKRDKILQGALGVYFGWRWRN